MNHNFLVIEELSRKSDYAPRRSKEEVVQKKLSFSEEQEHTKRRSLEEPVAIIKSEEKMKAGMDIVQEEADEEGKSNEDKKDISEEVEEDKHIDFPGVKKVEEEEEKEVKKQILKIDTGDLTKVEGELSKKPDERSSFRPVIPEIREKMYQEPHRSKSKEKSKRQTSPRETSKVFHLLFLILLGRDIFIFRQKTFDLKMF